MLLVHLFLQAPIIRVVHKFDAQAWQGNLVLNLHFLVSNLVASQWSSVRILTPINQSCLVVQLDLSVILLLVVNDQFLVFILTKAPNIPLVRHEFPVLLLYFIDLFSVIFNVGLFGQLQLAKLIPVLRALNLPIHLPLHPGLVLRPLLHHVHHLFILPLYRHFFVPAFLVPQLGLQLVILALVILIVIFSLKVKLNCSEVLNCNRLLLVFEYFYIWFQDSSFFLIFLFTNHT